MLFDYPRLGLTNLEAVLIAAKRHVKLTGQPVEFEFNGRQFTVIRTSNLASLWCYYWNVAGPRGSDTSSYIGTDEVAEVIWAGWTGVQRRQAESVLRRLRAAS